MASVALSEFVAVFGEKEIFFATTLAEISQLSLPTVGLLGIGHIGAAIAINLFVKKLMPYLANLAYRWTHFCESKTMRVETGIQVLNNFFWGSLSKISLSLYLACFGGMLFPLFFSGYGAAGLLSLILFYFKLLAEMKFLITFSIIIVTVPTVFYHLFVT